jgi:hypothetical protein
MGIRVSSETSNTGLSAVPLSVYRGQKYFLYKERGMIYTYVSHVCVFT